MAKRASTGDGDESRGYDRHALYERCVQSVAHAAALLRAIHGGEPTILGEDFAGTGALSRHWVGSDPSFEAIAVDHDAAVLSRCAGAGRVRTIVGDVRTASSPKRDRADIIFVGNFSIGEIHQRPDLVEYLRHARSRLRDGGVFVCDTYGGESAFVRGDLRREHPGPDGERILYAWQQVEADPLTGRVVNALHFRVVRRGRVLADLPEAFVYHWRLWSVPELRDAMRDAGFARTEVYAQLVDAVDDEGRGYAAPVQDADELGDSFIVCVCGRA